MKLHRGFFYITLILTWVILLLIWIPEIVRIVDNPQLPYRIWRIVGLIVLFGTVSYIFVQLRRQTDMRSYRRRHGMPDRFAKYHRTRAMINNIPHIQAKRKGMKGCCKPDNISLDLSWEKLDRMMKETDSVLPFGRP